MTIQEYQKEAKRTCASLGSDDLNHQHMLLGVISETGELADAYKKHIAYGKELDRVNVLEEIADCCWYIANFATFYDIALKESPKSLFVDVKEELRVPANIIYTFTTMFADFKYRKIIVEGVQPYQHNFNLLRMLSHFLGFSQEEFYQALENNINKLKIRYPEKFTQENALNRDLTKERTELEK